MAKDIPINPRIIQHLANATVKNLIDGIVELVTNSDDSYRRMESRGIETCGKIIINVSRQKGGFCEQLTIRDFAEGMTKEELEKAIEFAGETSGFSSGKSVRGFFGRGLKETIISLGEGTIRSYKNGVLCQTKIWFDGKVKKPLYDEIQLENTQKVNEEDGTEIKIKIMNKRIKIPEFEKFIEQITLHYALRDITCANNRKVILEFYDIKREKKNIKQIKFTYPYPESVERLYKKIKIPKYNDEVTLRIYESKNQLTSPKNNPYGTAGILIKSKSAILDNQLFKFENDENGLFFYGEALCENLDDIIRNGETGIIDPNRSGLEWKHDYCRILQREIENYLEPFISMKKRETKLNNEYQIKPKTKKLLDQLKNELNKLANFELEEIDIPIPEPREEEINHLIIKPERANLEVRKPRTFSVYAPDEMVKLSDKEVIITSTNNTIRVFSQKIKLKSKNSGTKKIWTKDFKVVGDTINEEGRIEANLSGKYAYAEVKIIEKIKPTFIKRTNIKGHTSGFIRDIIQDFTDNPRQRVSYDSKDGVIKVYMKHPAVIRYLEMGFSNLDRPEARMLLAELVGDIFCKELARRSIELNKYPTVPGGEIDNFIFAVNDIQMKYLHKIQEIIFAWKF